MSGNEHEHNWWRHPDGSLRCECGEPVIPAPQLSAYEQRMVARFGIWDEES